jgi:hypothetical protein
MYYIGDFFIGRKVRLAPGLTATDEKVAFGPTALRNMDAQATIPGNGRLCSGVLENRFLCHLILQAR